MDAIELLAREDEFKRLNKQLEKKTESLMKQIENEMQKQDFFCEFSPSLTLPTQQNYKKHCCTPPTQPETPIKNIIKKKTLILESPKSLDSDESELEFQTENAKKGTKFLSHISRNEKKYNQNKKGVKTSEDKSEKDDIKTEPNKKHNRVACDCCPHSRSYRNDDLEFLYAFVNVNVRDKILPPSFSKEDRVTVESVCKFLSSKIKLMQEQIDKLQNAIEKKASQCESHLTQLAELESERMALLNKTNNMKSSSADIRAKYMALQKRFEEKEKQYKEQRSETDKQAAELKRLRSKNANVEARCASQEQVIDALKQQLEMSKRSEKELRDSTRQLSSTYEGTIARLESSVASLTARAEKQAALTLNLRKQNALLAAGGAVDNLNVDYAAFLNQDFK